MKYLLSTNSALQSTQLSDVGLAFTIGMCLLLLILPRRFAVVPIFLTACYMTFGQQLVVAGLHFTILRVLVVVAYLRITLRGEARHWKWQRLDTLVLCWSLSGIFFFTVLWESPAAVINRFGVACDTAGLYFSFRVLVRDNEDVKMACKLFAVMLAPLALCMAAERLSGGRNPFYALGGVSGLSEIRRGVVRCQGPFGHPILAGTFGAVWPSLFVGLWCTERKSRWLAILGTFSATAIMVFAGSSGPILTYLSGVLATCMWLARKHMRTVRWLIVLAVVALQCVMTDPVWFIFARVNVLSGSTGWHRSNLINQFVNHFSDWWWCGTKEVGAWGVFAGDVTNQYILEGVNGGLLTASLFIMMIAVAFGTIGKAMKQAGSNTSKALVWAVGCALFSHCMTFLSVSYFDQNVVNFYLVLAMAAVICPAPLPSFEPAADFAEHWSTAGIGSAKTKDERLLKIPSVTIRRAGIPTL